MALVNVSTNTGGDFVPIVKYDARAGRLFRIDKDETGSNPVDITKNFRAVFDFEQVEVGWILFSAGGAPDFRMAPYGAPNMPERPTADYKQGVRMRIKLSPACGGDVREIAGTSAAFLRGINALHDEWMGQKAANTGKLPIVSLEDTLPVESGAGAKRSTNYQPVFRIVGWAPRPADMPLANGHVEPAPATRPAATRPPANGSTVVAPPATKPVPVASIEDTMAEDFG